LILMGSDQGFMFSSRNDLQRDMMDSLIPVHVGLMGHIDHGKTALARALSEHVSTAGLDGHPQAQQRGITIDLGFTMFALDKYLVTLVDAPGHADLIRSVVAGANIIDSAILVVAADEGPKVQTGEHLVVLSSMGIGSLVVAITKIDIASDQQAALVETRMRKITEDAGFKNAEFVRVSAQSGVGIDKLREVLLRVLIPKVRDLGSPLLMPIDHGFPIIGHGTVITGTILRGKVAEGDLVEIAPLGLSSRVRSIQTFSQSRTEASAGDRVGINIPEINHSLITRGNYLCSPKSIPSSDRLLTHISRNPVYHGRVTKKMVVSVALGMPVLTGQIIPFQLEQNYRVILDSVDEEEFDAALFLQHSVAIDRHAKVLILRTDLPPTHMRIVGSGFITEIPESIHLHRRKTRTGKIQRVRDEDVLVEGLASSKKVAESLIGCTVRTRSNVDGIIRTSFGTRGVVSVEFKAPIKEKEEVIYERFVEEEHIFGS
ncbi:MAG: selenocysteine-specific translation elongation factor, partial [Candidatus Thorarchaeota archaeon]|nr:selenocysteine-specific translation elongation factor [Candidatus Thorarchaeota archaeon]